MAARLAAGWVNAATVNVAKKANNLMTQRTLFAPVQTAEEKIMMDAANSTIAMSDDGAAAARRVDFTHLTGVARSRVASW
jgi:hypothetical protein